MKKRIIQHLPHNKIANAKLRHSLQWLGRAVALIFFSWTCWQPASLQADDQLELKATVNRNQIYLGESFILEITIASASRDATPDLSQIQNCQIKSLGSRDISNYSFTIINGRLSKQGFSGRVATYEITPTVAGPLRMGPITVEDRGKTVTTPGPLVNVTDIEDQDFVHIFIEASHDTTLPDEPFDITLRVLIRRLTGKYAFAEPLFPGNPPDISVPYLSMEGLDGLQPPDIQQILQNMVVSAQNRPGLHINNITLRNSPFDFESLFSGFGFAERKARFGLPHRPIEFNGKDYLEYSLTLTFVPHEENNYVFGPIIFKGDIPVEVDDTGQARSYPVFAVGSACTVRVVPPPEEGRPLSFTGALGTDLTVDASLDTQTANVGDPLKLTLNLGGQGRFDKMLPPKLALQTNLAAHFDIYDSTVQTTKGEQERTYTYTLRPNHPGFFDLPPIEISYYNTQKRAYETIYSQAIPLQIKKGEEITAGQMQGHTSLVTKAKQPGQAQETPAPIRVSLPTTMPTALRAQSCLPVTAAVGPLFYLSILGLARFRQQQTQWLLAARRRRALPSARRQLQAARRLARDNPQEAGHQARQAICGYMAERLDASAGLTPDDLQRLLLQNKLPLDTTRHLLKLFETCFNAEFARQTGDLSLNDSDFQQLIKILAIIDRATHDVNPSQSQPIASAES